MPSMKAGELLTVMEGSTAMLVVEVVEVTAGTGTGSAVRVMVLLETSRSTKRYCGSSFHSRMATLPRSNWNFRGTVAGCRLSS